MVRRSTLQEQPPFTSYDTSGFWPIDVSTGRAATARQPNFSTFTAPGATVNFFTPVNGHATGKPFRSVVAASGGTLFWYDGIGWQRAIGTELAAVDTGRAVFGAPFLQHAVIMVEDNPPIDFDYVTGEATYLEAVVGAVPEDCRIAFTHAGSLWIAGQENNPHILYGSRVGDMWDWDFLVDPDDLGGAFATGGVNEGLLNGPITAGFAHTSNRAIISTVEGIVSMWGHPRSGGNFLLVDETTYILGQGAWTIAPGDVAYFMTPLGLMRLGPGDNTATPISQQAIPDELVGLTYDEDDHTIAMAYSSRWKGIYITDRATSQAWLFRPDEGGFHKIVTSNYPYRMQEFRQFISADEDGVLWGKS